MTTHRETRFVAAPLELLFDLVADVERYPEFLSLWRSAHIYQREEGGYFTDQEIGLGPIRERFRTHTRLMRPEWIDVTSVDPLFQAFHIHWDFAAAQHRVRVQIALTWKVRSRLLQHGIDAALPVTARRMIAAFEDRARQAKRRHARPLAPTGA
jgi:ribosome-associated toxin RatA of RatAB toxin-antitoxin module